MSDAVRALQLCDQLRNVATELRNVLVQLGAEPGAIAALGQVAPLGKTLSRTDAARRCGVTVNTFDAHVRPLIPEIKIGSRRMFLESDLDAWLTREEATANAKPRTAARPGRRRVGADKLTDPKALAILARLKGGKARV